MLEDYISAFKGGFSLHSELRAQRNVNRAVTLLEGNLISNARTEESGVSARVYKNGVYGFASGAEYSPERVVEILAAAGRNAEFMDSRVRKGRPAFPQSDSGEYRMSRVSEDVRQRVYIDFAKEIDEYIAKKYPGLASRRISVRADAMEKLFIGSDGFESYSLVPRSFTAVLLAAEAADGDVVELYKVFGGHGYFGEQFASPDRLYPLIDETFGQLMKKAEGVYAEAGLRDVVLHPNLAGILAHEAVGHTVEADLVIGGSVAGPNLNRRVASDIVTMVDFANTLHDGTEAPLPIYVDDEGTPASDEVLIRDGILVGYMNSRETAQHFGMTPRGNARAYRFSDEPLIRMRNTGILPGKSKLEDMIAAVEDGYYLQETGNGQADTTGEFMFGVNMGYEIKGGKLGRAIRDTTISGVAFEMLKGVDMLSDDNIWTCSGMCGKKQPMPVGMGGPAVKCRVTIGGR